MKRTALLRWTSLKRTKGLNKVSKKQARENALWSRIKRERQHLLLDKFGYIPCEWCKKRIVVAYPDGHHNKGRANTLENCRILHRLCHTYITDNNIKDVPNLLEEKQ